MQWLDFKKDMCLSQIRSLKNSIMMQRGITYLNFFLVCLNTYIIYHYTPINLFTTLCTGAMIANVFWCLSLLFSLKQDLKLEKEFLVRIKEMEANDEYQDDLKNLQAQIEYYKDLARYNEIRFKIPSEVCPENTPPESMSPTVEK